MRLSVLLSVLLCSPVFADDDEPTPYPKPIRIGDLEITPVSATVGPVPLKTIAGYSSSKEPVFFMAIRLKNSSATNRVVFDGWPHDPAFGQMNLRVIDEHGNRYRPIDFGLGSRAKGDSPGEAIEPGKSLLAIVVSEKPVPVAKTLVVDLEGEAIEQKGKRLRWSLRREDWEPPPEPKLATAPPPRDPLLRTWTTTGGDIEASFVSSSSTTVKLKKTDGAEIRISFDKLSPADRRWIADHIKAKRIPIPTRAPCS